MSASPVPSVVRGSFVVKFFLLSRPPRSTERAAPARALALARRLDFELVIASRSPFGVRVHEDADERAVWRNFEQSAPSWRYNSFSTYPKKTRARSRRDSARDSVKRAGEILGDQPPRARLGHQRGLGGR